MMDKHERRACKLDSLVRIRLDNIVRLPGDETKFYLERENNK